MERYGLRGNAELNEVVNVLASGIGSLVNPLRIANTIQTVKGKSISQNTVDRCLDCLEDSFLVSHAIRFDVKGRRYIGTPMKYYFTDVGLRNARLSFRQQEEGHIMENVIYMKSGKEGLNSTKEFYPFPLPLFFLQSRETVKIMFRQGGKK